MEKKLNEEFTQVEHQKNTQSAETVITSKKDSLNYVKVDEKGRKYIRIVGCDKKSKTLKIPAKLAELPVEAIGEAAFKGNDKLEEIIMPVSVTEIGAEAFMNCTALESVELSSEMETIRKSCFENCTELKTIVLPYELKTVETNAFKNCKKLKRAYHFVKTGIGATETLSRKLTEEKLPSGMLKIESGAFENCESVESVYVPYKVETIPADAYRGCKSLKEVAFHRNMKSISEGAFAGCTSLKSIKLPLGIESVSSSAFDSDCVIRCYEGTSPAVLASFENNKVLTICSDPLDVDSKMVPGKTTGTFYSEEELERALEEYELRTPIVGSIDREAEKLDVVESRYTLENGKYHYNNGKTENVAKILMVGDLMCRPTQITSAFKNGEYNFDQEFDYVRDIISDSDLAIGNMETMVARSIVYSDDAHYIDDRVHLNAPDSYLNSVRKAGFDVVINSQNHAYDAGTKGVYETLNALNKQQLMHTGIFASDRDKRYISLQINGINVAVVSYFDQARQGMKRVNYTERGLNVLYSNFYEEQIREDIENARKEGAEFVIAYCHWGREYVNTSNKRQENFARMVANAGADYLFGSHAHCLQPYDVITTNDGRKVPVLYSAGNFLSDMSIKMPIVRDTLIAELQLYRDETGKVQIKSEGYHPCLIRADKINVRGRMYTVPISTLLAENSTPGSSGLKDDVKKILNKLIEDNKTPTTTEQLNEDIKRIHGVVGTMPRFRLLIKDEVNPMVQKVLDDGSRYGKYTLKKPLMIEVEDKETVPESRYVKPEGSNVYEGTNNLETKEAVLMCAGQICYDANMGNRAKFGNYYNFRENFQLVKKCFDKADFVIGNFAAMADDSYLSAEMMKNEYNSNLYYSNARMEYLDALKYAGFDCLAAANKNNMDVGVNGIWKTVENIGKYGMTTVGIGEEKNKIFNINDIKVGVLSYTMDCRDVDTMITAEGADKLLNIYSAPRAKRDIAELKANGAEFVLVYLACGDMEKHKLLVPRKNASQELAEFGADYVICTIPKRVTKYYKYKTEDGRTVPVATSIGTFMSGTFDEESRLGALLRITLYKTAEGGVEFADDYIPLKRFESLDGYNYAVAPSIKAFYPKRKLSQFTGVDEAMAEKIGNEIKMASDRIVKIDEYTQAHLTFERIYKIAGAEPSEQDKELLDMKKKATCVAARKAELKEGCVAILVQHFGYKKPEFQIEPEDVRKAKAALAIAAKPVEGVPTIIIENGNLKEIVRKLYKAIIRKYKPLTVAITGTAGKTTTKEFTSCVFDTHYKTLHVVGNYNQFYTCGTVLQKLDSTYEAYVQEVHGGTKNSAKRISNLIEPDIAIITNIGDGHLLDMGTIENVIQGKLDIASGLKETGVLIVNNDNEYMKDLKMEGKRIIHYSTFDTNCEYYAQNIQNCGNKVKFQVVCEKGTFDLVLNMQGLHNVGNAVAVFAAATEAGIPPHKIRAGLTHYTPDADKQNLMHFNGYNMIVDTYSATPISVESAMQTLSEYPVEDGARRIAVLGDIPALGDASEEKHKELGERICHYNFDLMLCVGTDSRYFAEAARKIGKEAYSYQDREEFNRKLAESIHPGDFILFKSGTRSHLKEETIYPLFGLIDKQ